MVKSHDFGTGPSRVRLLEDETMYRVSLDDLWNLYDAMGNNQH